MDAATGFPSSVCKIRPTTRSLVRPVKRQKVELEYAKGRSTSTFLVVRPECGVSKRGCLNSRWKNEAAESKVVKINHGMKQTVDSYLNTHCTEDSRQQ